MPWHPMLNTANKPSGEIMDEQLRSNLTSSKHWVRFLYMILFAFFLYIASFLMVVLVVVQFVFALLSGSENSKLRVLGYELTSYINQNLLFLTYNSDHKPFPFADWPTAPVEVQTRTVAVLEPDTSSKGPDVEPFAPAGGTPVVSPAPGGSPASGATPAVSNVDERPTFATGVDIAEDSTARPVSGTDGGVAIAGDAIATDTGPSVVASREELDPTPDTDASFGQAGFTENDDIVRDEETGFAQASDPEATASSTPEDAEPASPKRGRSRRT